VQTSKGADKSANMTGRIKGMKHDWTLQILWFGISDTSVLGFLEVPSMYVCTKEWAIDGLILSGKHFLGESSSQIGQAPKYLAESASYIPFTGIKSSHVPGLPPHPTQSPMIEGRLLPCYPKQWCGGRIVVSNLTQCVSDIYSTLYVHFVDVHVP
jgi:hypothetical protein